MTTETDQTAPARLFFSVHYWSNPWKRCLEGRTGSQIVFPKRNGAQSLRLNGQISCWGQRWAFPVLRPVCRGPQGPFHQLILTFWGMLAWAWNHFHARPQIDEAAQTHTVHSNFSNSKTETIQIFHMHRGQHPSCFYSKSPSIGIHGNRWVAFSHPCGDIDHWLTLKYECLLSVDT